MAPGPRGRQGGGPAGQAAGVSDQLARTALARLTDVTRRVSALENDSGGSGLPAGGTTGQVLQKASASDGDVVWADRPTPTMEIPWHSDASSNMTLTNSPVAERWALNQPNRMIKMVPIAGHTQVRLIGNQVTTSASVNTPRLRLLYKTGSYSSTIANYSSLAASGDVEISLTGTGFKDSGWVTLAAAATGDIFVGLAESGGDAAADPAMGYVNVYFR